MSSSAPSALNPQDVISFVLLNSGGITNHDLVRRFRPQLKDPQLGEENKRLLKNVTGKVAQVERLEGGGKTIHIKPRYADKSAAEIYSEYLYQCATKDEFNVFMPKSEDVQQQQQQDYDHDDKQQRHRERHYKKQQHHHPSHHHEDILQRRDDVQQQRHHHDLHEQQQQQQQQQQHEHEVITAQKPPKLPPRNTDNSSSNLGKPPPLPEKKVSHHHIHHGVEDEINANTPRRRLSKEGHVLFKKREEEEGAAFERSSFRRKTVKDKGKKKKHSVPNLHSTLQEVDDDDVFAKAQSDHEDETSKRIKSKRKKFKTTAQKSVKDLTKDFDELATTSQLKLTDHIKDGKHQTAGNRNLLKRPVKQQSKVESNWGPLPKVERQWILAASRNDFHAMEKMITRHMAAVRDPLNGYTALHWAAKHGNLKMIKRLLTFGAAVNQGSRGGYTPLMLAAMTEREVAYQFLLSVPECNPNVRDYSGKRALDYAMKKKSSETGSIEENSSEVGYDGDEDDTDSGGKRKKIMLTVDRSSSFLRGIVRESGRSWQDRRGNSRDGYQ